MMYLIGIIRFKSNTNLNTNFGNLCFLWASLRARTSSGFSQNGLNLVTGPAEELSSSS